MNISKMSFQIKIVVLLLDVWMMFYSSAFAQKDTFQLNLEIIQKDKRFAAKAGFNSFNIGLDAFSLEFNSKVYTDKKFYGVKIAAIKDKADLNIAGGEEIYDVPYLVPGTGLANEKGVPYSSLLLTAEAHHYIIWEVKGEKRAELVKQDKENIRLRWDINTLTFKSKTFTIPQSTFLTIYLVVFMDANLNEKLDEGEWSVAELNFR